MATSRMERILILAKTYPSPSTHYVETSCVAGITEHGSMRRLYPIPFRLIEDGQQFRKWQWIDVRVEKATTDHRPESHRVYVDTVVCGPQIDTRQDWAGRRAWPGQMPGFEGYAGMDAARVKENVSLALLRPSRVIGLEIRPARHAEWTADEREKLAQSQMELFAESEARKEVRQLRKIPFDFYYHCEYSASDGEVTRHHKIVDWEAGALYWNCLRLYGPTWEEPFRAKLEGDLLGKDLMFLMGNQHRFQDQWLIVSLIYPPRLPPLQNAQGALF
ncbi:hypothetical protein [Dyella sp. 2RAB6]|uniref:hypothetical protein n=1 Tax=Dyella sp. 2RAB6 TaxID=3232992 RepID=UPI003F8F3AC3